MQQVVLFDPSYGTWNVGDNIINEALMAEMEPVFEGRFVTRYSTHTPLLDTVQALVPNDIQRYCDRASLKFLGGTNLFKTNLLARRPDWNVNPVTASLYRGSIAIGCGTGGSGGIENSYTRGIYRKILSTDFVHSTRDARTADLLCSLGVEALNTGCPTMWSLTPQHCARIPVLKADKVVFTVTDYNREPVADLAVLDVLLGQYDEVFVWVQGSEDHDYLTELGILDRVTLINPGLNAYRSFLMENEVDYVGTRLHGGIYAMRHFRRSIILAVDNRALDIQETYNLNVVPRRDVNTLKAMVAGDLETSVRLDEEAIATWKRQFVR